ncbi:MAG: glycosyltransferase [Methylococcaceae bacterium]|nr:glycosyltransferase [Methylococcaceae bacterium]
MRILHVIENLNTGGAEHMLVNLVTEQIRRQNHVAVLCLFEAGDLAGNLTALGVNVTACHKNSGLNLSVILTLIKRVYQFAPDVLHSHSLMGNYYMAFVRLFAAPRAVQVVTRHGLLREGKVGRLGFLFHLSLWMTHWAVGVCDAVSAELISKHARFSLRILTINNGIDLARFKPCNSGSQQALKLELKLGTQTRLVGIVARLNPIKNHHLLLEAFALVQQQVPHSALVIVGDGELRRELEAYTQTLKLTSSVFFLGDRTDVNTLLAGLDVFVLSSNNEGYSLALLEAAAGSLPLVATAVGGNADIVEHNQNGLIVPPKQPTALAAALIKLLENPERANLMGNNARIWVEKNASVQAMADAYEQLYTRKA